MRDAHDWLDAQNRKNEADAIAKVLDFRLSAASAAYRIRLDLENIEELFSLAAASPGRLTDDIRLAIAATLDFKIATCRDPQVGFQSNSLNSIPSSWLSGKMDGVVTYEPYDFKCPAYDFYLTSMLGSWGAKSVSLSENSFITFNYDLLVEEALTNMSIPYTYGITSKAERSLKSVEVLKLHGSVNWAKSGTSKTKYIAYNSYDELRISGQVPQLVPPTWRKIFTGPLRQVWDRSLKSLEKATRIIVIGFSIPPTDNHFKYLIGAGLKNNISLREIVFVNPDAEQIDQRAGELFGEITKSSSVKIIGKRVSQFTSQGINFGCIGDFGRPIPSNIQNIHIK